jgi:hypothetical protein
MKTHSIATVAVLGLVLAAGLHGIAQTPADNATIEDIRNKLLRLPYYGVCDFLPFSYDKGTVTLSGYAAHAGLKNDAGRAVRQVARVDQVVNRIEELPVSQNDDDLRWKTYYAIYSDPFLARYAPGGGLLWGHRHRMGRVPFGSAARFPGLSPTGNYRFKSSSRTERSRSWVWSTAKQTRRWPGSKPGRFQVRLA